MAWVGTCFCHRPRNVQESGVIGEPTVYKGAYPQRGSGAESLLKGSWGIGAKRLNLKAFWVLDINEKLAIFSLFCKLFSITSINPVKMERWRAFWWIFMQKMVTFTWSIFHKKWTSHLFVHEKLGPKQHWLIQHCNKWFRGLRLFAICSILSQVVLDTTPCDEFYKVV